MIWILILQVESQGFPLPSFIYFVILYFCAFFSIQFELNLHKSSISYDPSQFHLPVGQWWIHEKILVCQNVIYWSWLKISTMLLRQTVAVWILTQDSMEEGRSGLMSLTGLIHIWALTWNLVYHTVFWQLQLLKSPFHLAIGGLTVVCACEFTWTSPWVASLALSHCSELAWVQHPGPKHLHSLFVFFQLLIHYYHYYLNKILYPKSI